ncbi:MAG: energy transducer TonB [Spirochaetales bacterium]|jgi:protein TonB|nr:energy transducer TonB [Spirochaetales bacterium]
MNKLNLTRAAIFCAVALLHAGLLVFMVVRMDSPPLVSDTPLAVLKLADVREAPPPPPPPDKPPVFQQSPESVAEKMIETETPPPPPEYAPAPQVPQSATAETYLPMHRISVGPSFDEAEFLRTVVYPPIALRSGLEGMVYLEVFIDSRGNVQRVDILKENPENYGFGEAAARALRKQNFTPARANGVAVAVRYRYPVRFKQKG